tara:strand:+ start:324 stop:968 length:645 start_codon:yes stop_codon:yes gene_type:complete
MINYKEIEQGTIEWFELKWGKIGGTLAKGLFVKSDTLFLEILSQKLEEFEPTDSFTNEAMEHGNINEPFAREYLETYTGIKFEETGWLQNEENELIGISPDGITKDEKTACEIKCFGRKKHLSVLLENEIPLEHINQCIHYFTANHKLEKLYFIAFRHESVKHFIKELTLESTVNIGTKSKPRLMTLEAARDYANEFADDLLIKVNKTKDNISF